MKELLSAHNPYDVAVPLILLLLLAASCAAFWLLVRRWTTQRRWLALQDWAAANDFSLRGEQRAIRPEALSVLGDAHLRVLLSLNDLDTAILQVQTSRMPNQSVSQPARWNLLVRRIESSWPLIGLRPSSRPTTVLDFLPLSSMRVASPGERYVMYTSERAAGTALAKSPARALLPADIGLILTGHYLILDFSTRPFDPLEFQRMDSLAEQLVARLPAQGT